MVKQLECKNCGTNITAQYVNMDKLLAICPNCHALQDISNMPRPRPARRKLKPPRALRINEQAEGIEIHQPWMNPHVWMVTVFAVIWNGIMCFAVTMVLSNGTVTPLLCMSLHILAGVGVGYYVLLTFINSTMVKVDEENLIIRHGPLPSHKKSIQLDRRVIQQLYVKERTISSNNTSRQVYDVYTLTKSKHDYDSDEKLLDGLDSPTDALFIEQQIEHYLGIDDEPVHGEYTGRY